MDIREGVFLGSWTVQGGMDGIYDWDERKGRHVIDVDMPDATGYFVISTQQAGQASWGKLSFLRT